MKTVQEIIDDSAIVSGPRVSELVRIRPGGVDPLGLRQINFNLMDQLFPQLNNVARHIRPLTVMAWAWRCAWKSAENVGLEEVPVSTLREMVDRIEVIFVWSQLLVHDSVDLPGSAYLKTRLKSSYTFAGENWTQIQEARRYSTSLSAAVNYGPSLFNLCFARRGVQRDEVRVHPLADAALDSLESLLGDEQHHPAFTKFGEVTVTQTELKLWGGLWDIKKITEAECEHIATTLGGKEAPLKRQHGIRLLKTAIERIKERGDSAVRTAMCDSNAVNDDSQLLESALVWRGIQARQLFRPTLEALLYWATVEVSDRPSTIERMALRFLEDTPNELTVAAWLALSGDDPDAVDIISPIIELEKLLRGRVRVENLPNAIFRGLRTALSCKAIDSSERQDRLPLARAQEDSKSFADKSSAQFMEYVLSAWAIGQHVYWSVSRGIGDARRGTDQILRLKIVPDEAGLRIVPGANNSAPRTTPDRLGTAISLLQEAREIQ